MDDQTKSMAENFYECFKESLKQSNDVTYENYQNNSSWTAVMLGEKRLGEKRIGEKRRGEAEGILSDVIKKFEGEGIQTEKEYYRVDIIGYKNRKNELIKLIDSEECKDELRKGNLSPFLWDLLVAVEHENDRKKWLDEVCKLSYIRCPLRVVITYGWNGKDEIPKGIEIAKKILKETKAFVPDSNQEFLIIMGCSSNSFKENLKDNHIEKCFIGIIITEDNEVKALKPQITNGNS